MKTRILQTKFWDDNFIFSLSPLEKLIFLYYLTNSKVNIIHCYECPDGQVISSIGVSIGVLKKAQDKFRQAGKIDFYNGYVKLLNAKKYETYSGDKNEGAKENLIKEMSPDILAWYNNPFDTPIDRGMDRGTMIPPINHKSETINHKSEEGVVKGKELSEQDFEEIATDYKVPVSFVISKWDDIQNWCASKGKTYRDYKATLRNWVKKDSLQIRKEENGKSKITIISPDPTWEKSS